MNAPVAITIPNKAQFEALKLLAAESGTLSSIFVTRDLRQAFMARHGDSAVVIEWGEGKYR